MGLRKGEYLGLWCPVELKRTLIEAGQKQHRTLSQEVLCRLERSLTEAEVKAMHEWEKKGRKDAEL